MRTPLALVAILLTATTAAAQDAWKGYTQGVEWEDSLASARNRAMEESKPILLHQLVGDMNKVGC